MTKRLLYFFRQQDEEELSDWLLERFPSLKFIDGDRWPTSEPPLAGGIHLCSNPYVFFWPSELVHRLPSLVLPLARQLNGMLFQGPTAGPVLQFQRCRERNDELDMGQLAVTVEDHDDPVGAQFLSVIALMKRRYACRLDVYSVTTGGKLNENLGGYLVGRSIQNSPTQSPRLKFSFGRDEYLICPRKS